MRSVRGPVDQAGDRWVGELRIQDPQCRLRVLSHWIAHRPRPTCGGRLERAFGGTPQVTNRTRSGTAAPTYRRTGGRTSGGGGFLCFEGLSFTVRASSGGRKGWGRSSVGSTGQSSRTRNRGGRGGCSPTTSCHVIPFSIASISSWRGMPDTPAHMLPSSGTSDRPCTSRLCVRSKASGFEVLLDRGCAHVG